MLSIALMRASSAFLTSASSSGVMLLSAANAAPHASTSTAINKVDIERMWDPILGVTCKLQTRLLPHEAGVAPVGVIGQIEIFAWFDDERNLLLAVDWNANCLRRILAGHALAEHFLATSFDNKHAITPTFGFAVDADGRREQAEFAFVGERQFAARRD